MQNTVVKGLLMTFTLFFAALVIQVVLYQIELVKAQNFVSNIISIAERNGGFKYSHGTVTYDMTPQILRELQENNMDFLSYAYTEGRVDYNQPLTFAVRGKYEFTIFSMFGAKVSAPIWAERSGLSQVYIRK